jgi:RNA polymerase sigma factor (sigma-70 family)
LEKSYPDDIMPTIDFSDYLDGLYSYAVMMSRNRTEAEDLVQETCLRALRAMQRLRPDSNVKSWLFTILRLSHARAPAFLLDADRERFDLAQLVVLLAEANGIPMAHLIPVITDCSQIRRRRFLIESSP